MTIDKYDLSIRAINVLRANNIIHIEELLQLTKKAFYAFKGINVKTVQEIEEMMAENNLKFKEE